MADQIETKVMGVFRRGEKLLVTLDTDRVTGERYARPLGGKIEFGERAIEALRRELREEIGAAIDRPQLLRVLENLYTLDGSTKHEVVFVFSAELTPSALYDAPQIPRKDKPDRSAVWLPLANVRSGAMTLYPAGLLRLTESAQTV